MRDLFISTEATSEPLELDEVKAFVGYHGDDDDVMSTLYNIALAARLRLEEFCGRNFAEKTMTLNIDSVKTRFYLPYPPINEVTSIKVYDEDGVLDETWTEGTEYFLLGDFHKYLRLESYAMGEYINIIYTSGYGSNTYTLPRGIKRALLAQIKYDFDHRSGAGESGNIMLTNEARMLIAPYREYAI